MSDQNGGLKYLKYAGMGFQLVAVIVIFVWAGIKLDERMDPNQKTYTLILSLFGIVLSFYFLFKSVKNLNK